MDESMASGRRGYMSNMDESMASGGRGYMSNMDESMASGGRGYMSNANESMASGGRGYMSNMDESMASGGRGYMGNMDESIDLELTDRKILWFGSGGRWNRKMNEIPFSPMAAYSTSVRILSVFIPGIVTDKEKDSGQSALRTDLRIESEGIPWKCIPRVRETENKRHLPVPLSPDHEHSYYNSTHSSNHRSIHDLLEVGSYVYQH
ncbi:hypothetical protein J6590_073141 [Homalodisca vitripennis]|nr:hypothetical protein J6590_073141 [Homalodisca vitripennis]